MVQSLDEVDNLNRWRRELRNPQDSTSVISPSSPHNPGTRHCQTFFDSTYFVLCGGGGGMDVVREAQTMYETGDADFEDFQNAFGLAKLHNAEPCLTIFSAKIQLIRFWPSSLARGLRSIQTSPSFACIIRCCKGVALSEVAAR